MLLIAGTFLPWLRSGQVHRNSYRTGGAIRRLLDVHGLLGALLAAWPFLGIACAAIVCLFALGLRRTAAGLALVPAAGAGAVGAAVLAVDGPSFAVPQRSGPLVTILGALMMIIAASLVLFPRGAGTTRAGRAPR